ncbi:ATP-binding protein [Sulfurivermis fontis]|uniref:ATP-binding protein n=1 Tax=Sulfurivermis fontis TaxID=1972068 RepID=UPI000FDB3A67|nr:ATP-binding protein [Sulfurivermis fontis]
MNSIRLRLLSLLMVIFLVMWLGIVYVTWWRTAHEAEEVYDAHLARAGHVLAGMVLHELKEPATGSVKPKPTAHDLQEEVAELEKLFFDQKYAAKLEFRIWLRGRPFLQSSGSPPSERPQRAGFADIADAGGAWRSYAMHVAEPDLMVQVVERHAVRETMINEITGQVLVPIILALPILVFAIWGGIGRGLRPLRQLAGEVERRSATQLDRFGRDTRIPREVQPLVTALNDLLARLEDAFARERRFTADAAHELRTPLASLKTQAQVALRARDDEDRRRALTAIMSGVDRASHLVEQLLTLARLDPEQGPGEFTPVALRALAEEAIGLCMPLAVGKQIDLGLGAAEALDVQGNPLALLVLVRNLIDNAVRYTPSGGQVEVSLRREGRHAVVAVADSGPGIPVAERQRVFERFHRGLGHDAQGCGLGLSIVLRIVEMHGGEVRLGAAPQGGLLAEVWLPVDGARI